MKDFTFVNFDGTPGYSPLKTPLARLTSAAHYIGVALSKEELTLLSSSYVDISATDAIDVMRQIKRERQANES